LSNEIRIVVSSDNKAQNAFKATKQAQKEIGEEAATASKKVKEFGVDSEVAGKRASQSFGNTSQGLSKLGDIFEKVGITAAGFLAANLVTSATQKLVEGFHASVDAASNLNESMNAVQKVFGSSQQKILDWGKNNANSFGLSQRAFNEMATPMGALLKNAGLNLDQVSTSTIKLTERASDMASVFNTDVSDALEAIQAGLRGETDPLEQYGVHLSAAAVEAEALTETHKKMASQLTDAELMTARLNLIMKETADTAGDFKDTSDGLANSQRIVAAKTEEVEAAIGQRLLPVMLQWSQFKLDVISEISDRFVPALDGAIAKTSEFKDHLDPQLKSALDNVKQGLGTNSDALNRYKDDVDLVQGALEALVGSSIALLIFNLEVLRGSLLLFDAAWNVFKTAAVVAIMVVINALGWIVDAAAKAFGWIPGIGQKLKDTARQFDEFRDQANRALGGILDKTVHVTIDQHYTISGQQVAGPVARDRAAFAAGGPVGAAGGGSRGGLVEVGEEGRELVRLPYGSSVVPHSNTEDMMAQGGQMGGHIVEMKVTGDIDSVFVTFFQKLLRTGQITISSKYVSDN
jgi:hypothetical protein